MKIEIPDEFQNVGAAMFDGVFDMIETEDDIYVMMAEFLNTEERRTVIAFLDEILSGDYSDADLEEIWSKSSSSYYIANGKIRLFLTTIRDRLKDYRESKSGRKWGFTRSEEPK